GAVQGTSDFGKRNYGVPCPPSGTHRYFFKIFALDTKLDLKPSARRAELDAAMCGHILAQGELMARYSHKLFRRRGSRLRPRVRLPSSARIIRCAWECHPYACYAMDNCVREFR